MAYVKIRTAHFEGSHTSYDWQGYNVEIGRQTACFVTLKTKQLIEGRAPFSGPNPEGFRYYKIRLDQIRGIDET